MQAIDSAVAAGPAPARDRFPGPDRQALLESSKIAIGRLRADRKDGPKQFMYEVAAKQVTPLPDIPLHAAFCSEANNDKTNL